MHHFLATADLEQHISQINTLTVLVGGVTLLVFTIAATLLKNCSKVLRLPLFLAMAGSLIIPTFVLFGSTVYLNNRSDSKGPVHWHADVEFWACGAELNLRDPVGRLSNKIGSPTFHEHNDKRLHLEGVVVKKDKDATLGKFMKLTGGEITKDRLALPLNKASRNDSAAAWFAGSANSQSDGDAQKSENFHLATGFSDDNGQINSNRWIEQTTDGPLLVLRNGEHCGNSKQAAELQTFVYSFNKKNKVYIQKKLIDPSNYILRDATTVPPGDCVIIEFDAPKPTTDKLCRQYGVRDKKRCTQFGVKSFDPRRCDIQQAPTPGGAF